ncbi:pentatricopeptide repeat-containing protein-like [Dorcoceras hygrometricum]|uniref:Pentatricopeptide repeat-containing protein-like n=1 Tax=Dorcoceras hygrometricum TaxID=472368 RepID=A0A2Z7CLP4_9LAMI|nr:pentatricopeptide repeat-containing protein-like [Dorcoceras hygrometricum]
MTRYIIYITGTLNAHGAPPADSSHGPADVPEKPATAKHTRWTPLEKLFHFVPVLEAVIGYLRNAKLLPFECCVDLVELRSGFRLLPESSGFLAVLIVAQYKSDVVLGETSFKGTKSGSIVWTDMVHGYRLRSGVCCSRVQLGERETGELVVLSGTPVRHRLVVASWYSGEESKSGMVLRSELVPAGSPELSVVTVHQICGI